MQQVALPDPHKDVLVASAVAELREPDPQPFHEQVKLNALRTLGPDSTDISESSAGCRTLVHAFEPVRDVHDQVIDFRLTFDHTVAPATARSFIGIQMVQCGPSVAPGEIFHILKRVLETGESQETVTRHLGAGQEVCFYQTAAKSGDVVVTTTSIVTIR